MSANYGSLKTLMLMLQEAPSLANASVVFGEEMINAKDQPYPMVVLVPIGGSWDMPGYYKDAEVVSPSTFNQWITQENIDLYCGAESTDPAATPIDHADACETFVGQVIQAFQNQQPYGLYYWPVSGKWVLAQDVINRRGRAYILTVRVDKTIPGIPPVNATVITETIIPTFDD